MPAKHAPRRGKAPPTIKDVATRAGVSPATVSNVLSGIRGVREDSRLSVIAAADALGYRSNHMASSLRRGTTRMIGIVVPSLANEYFASLVRRWEQHAAAAGYEILVVASEENVATEMQRVQSAIARRVDGLLIVSATDTFGDDDASAANLPPAVLVDRTYGHPRFDTVASDNEAAGYQGMQHLIQLGHRDIAVLISADNRKHLRDRIEGARRALAEGGLSERERLLIGGRNVDACRSAIEQELRRPDRPTAIFATTFFSTLGAIKAIHSLGIAFPRDISLVAFEHSEWMTVFRPYLTSVFQRVDEIAARSWDMLIARIARPAVKVTQVTIPVNFSIRESAQPYSARAPRS